MIPKNVILFDDDNWRYLLPFTYTRPVSEVRVGILTITEKWKLLLNAHVSYITQDHLAEKFPAHVANDNLLINSACLPTDKLIASVKRLNANEALMYKDEFLAARLDQHHFDLLIAGENTGKINGIDISNEEGLVKKISRPFHIFEYNGHELIRDFELLTAGKKSHPISNTNTILGDHKVFIDEGADIECTVINAKEGPVYIGKNVTIM